MAPPNSGSLSHRDLEKCHAEESKWTDEMSPRKLGKTLTERAAQQAGGCACTLYQKNSSLRALDNGDSDCCVRKNLI